MRIETHIKMNKLLTNNPINLRILPKESLQAANDLQIRNRVKKGVGKKINLQNFNRVI